ncbi:hypothetical protein LH22_12275 [Pantoea rwandensis]|uniref:Universal stress protein B n=1 Tax=Pantoea rwandensis TaxID=1076550 RepID=A0ABM5RJR6_9GAMM|nr:hypothetical protein LH22_12275 [Pantoea rwandensis]
MAITVLTIGLSKFLNVFLKYMPCALQAVKFRSFHQADIINLAVRGGCWQVFIDSNSRVMTHRRLNMRHLIIPAVTTVLVLMVIFLL